MVRPGLQTSARENISLTSQRVLQKVPALVSSGSYSPRQSSGETFPQLEAPATCSGQLTLQFEERSAKRPMAAFLSLKKVFVQEVIR